MKHLPRPNLSDAALRTLRGRTQRIRGAADPAAKAESLWRGRKAKADREIVRTLRRMVEPLERCMYCEDSRGVDVEHFRPKTTYPGSTFDWWNLLLACSYCNSNAKRTQFPLSASGQPLLLDPTRDDPAHHLDFSPNTGRFVARTDRGLRSIEVFGLNGRVLDTHRRTAVVTTCVLVKEYDALIDAGRSGEAELVRRTLRRLPHGSVVDWICATARRPGAASLLQADVVDAVVRRTELP